MAEVQAHTNSPPSPSGTVASELSSTLVVTPYLGIKLPVLGPKGHIEPHRTNLPRFTRRRRATARPQSPLSSTSSAPPSLSGAPPPSPRSIASSTGNVASIEGSASVAAAEPNDVPFFAVPEASTSAPSPAAPPTLNNLPRRRPVNTPQRRRRAWEIRTHMQHILPKSNIWTCLSSYNGEDPEEERVMAEFDRVVQIRAVLDDSEKVEEKGNLLMMSVHEDKCHDHGFPNITQEQLLRVWQFTNRPFLSSNHPRVLIMTSYTRAIDAVAIAVGHIVLSDSKKTKPLDLLNNIHDLDEDTMQDAWRGVLSSEGVEFLEETLDKFQSS